MKPEGLRNAASRSSAAGRSTIETYKLGDVYHCTIDNVDPGARFARAEGSTSEEAEAQGARESRALPRADAPFPRRPEVT